jgi:hypothetical protein
VIDYLNKRPQPAGEGEARGPLSAAVSPATSAGVGKAATVLTSATRSDQVVDRLLADWDEQPGWLTEAQDPQGWVTRRPTTAAAWEDAFTPDAEWIV